VPSLGGVDAPLTRHVTAAHDDARIILKLLLFRLVRSGRISALATTGRMTANRRPWVSLSAARARM
jgi:hypothetical protein